jgi:AsmA protein
MRAIRIIGITVGSLIVLLILFLIAVSLLVNPNAYKGRIERAVKSSTGRDLMLSGDLKLSVFPAIALRTGPASLGNPPGFPSTPFVTLRSASLRVALLPLLHGQLQIGRVEVDGLDARLLRNAKGEGNWSFSSGTSGAGANAKPAASSSSSSSSVPQIAGLVVRDARASYETYVIDHFDLTVGRVAAGVPIPVSAKLQVHGTAQPHPIVVTSAFQLTDGPQALRLSDLNLHVDESHITGEMSIAHSASDAMNFNLGIDRLDLDRYRTPTPAGKAPAASTSSSTFTLPTDSIKTLQADGKLVIGSLKLAGLTVTQLQLQARVHGGVASLAPMSAQVYGGAYRGDLTLDARGSAPVLRTNQNLSNVNVAQLMHDFYGTERLTGNGTITANLTGQGADTQAILRTLDGRLAMDLTHGAILGIDLPSEVTRAVALVKRQSAPSGSSTVGKTSFETFHASADVHQGVATTKDLDIATNLVRVRGQGTLNIASEAVNYQLQVMVLKGGAGTLADVPLTVSGTLAKLQVRPDLQQLAKGQLRQQLQQHSGQIQQKVEGALKGLLQRR